MNIAFPFWLFAMAFGASVLGGILGMASGIFIVPLLILFGGIEIHAAVAASIVSVIACSCASASSFLETRLTNIRLAVVLETMTTLGALSGVLLIGIIPVHFLYLLFAGILAISAKQMLSRRGDSIATTSANASLPSWADKLRLHSSYPDRSNGEETPYRVERLSYGMFLMYGAGLISALLGIGSGVLKIPAMDTTLRLPIKVSSATSNFMIGVTAAASAGAYFMRGDILPSIAGPVAIGSVLGSILGARILIRLSSEKLRLFLVTIVAALAIQMLLSAFDINLF